MICPVNKTDFKEAVDLVNDVFAEFVAVDYSEQGQKTFYDYVKTKYDELSKDIDSGHKEMWCYYEGKELAGVIATRDISHISLLFVAKKFQHRGIARQLFSTVIDNVKEQGIKEITVNSSPYAVIVYKKLGFVETGAEQQKDGIRFTPLKYELM